MGLRAWERGNGRQRYYSSVPLEGLLVMVGKVVAGR